jgi:hypothetical protein
MNIQWIWASKMHQFMNDMIDYYRTKKRNWKNNDRKKDNINKMNIVNILEFSKKRINDLQNIEQPMNFINNLSDGMIKNNKKYN